MQFKTKINRTTFYKEGGLSNPALFRKMIGGVWTYWRLSA